MKASRLGPPRQSARGLVTLRAFLVLLTLLIAGAALLIAAASDAGGRAAAASASLDVGGAEPREAPLAPAVSSFTDISAGLSGVTQSSLAWGDYDNDGKL